MGPIMRWLILLITFLSGSGLSAGERLIVYTVNYPLAYFAERIGGDAVEVVFPAPPDVDPAFWQPDVSTITAYQSADLVLLNGAGYARWIGTASLSRRRSVDTSAGFRDRYIADSEMVTHSHGPKGEHSHSKMAFTTWLDMLLAIEQARAVAVALRRHLPDRDSELTQRLTALETDLRMLDQRLLALTASAPPMFASHPIYQYLAARYGLDLRSVHWEPRQAPDAMAWGEFHELQKSHPGKWMLWEAPPLAETRSKLDKLGVGSIVFTPCANRPTQGDWLSVMRTNVEHLELALGE